MSSSSALLFALMAVAGMRPSTPSHVYISNAGSGTISAYDLDKSQGRLAPIGVYKTGAKVMPSVASADKKTLYVSVRSEPYRIVAWHIADDGKLSHPRVTFIPAAMAYMALDKTGRFLLASSYSSDIFAIYRLRSDDGIDPEPVQIVHTGKRAHSLQTDPTNRFLYVALLGADQMLQYRFDAATGHVTANSPSFINVQSMTDTGPRHFVFSPHGDDYGQQDLYLLTEMAGNITRMTIAADGTLVEHESTPSIDPGIANGMQRGSARPLTGDDDLPPSLKPRFWQADIHMTPDGQFLYSSDRTSSTLSMFRVTPGNGALHFFGSIKTESQPRGFAIDDTGRYLIATGQKASDIALYAINPRTGELSQRAEAPTEAGGNWVTIVE